MKKEIVFKILVVLLVLVVIGSGVSFAYWTIGFEQTGQNIMNTASGCFNAVITGGKAAANDAENSINLTNILPMDKSKETTLTPYALKVTNSCDTENIQYNVILNRSSDSTLPDANIYLRARLNNSTTGELLADKLVSAFDVNPVMGVTGTVDGHNFTNGSAKYVIKDRKITPGQSETIYLRLWMDENTTAEQGQNKTYYSKITVEALPM